ncbi:MAG TPA: histidine--tRNA ligase [Pyrinomonadaceae bacterium]|nr:histidine--tRNA ligase [Pyrinomonadaceae bacterium]
MPSAKTQPARGMRDFLPEDVRKREYVIGVIKEVYERYGFEPLETPAAENIETLMGKYGEEGNQLIYKILKRGVHEGTGEADLALRYDLTVPLARVVAEYRDKLPKFFKRYQIQPVWRADRPARGRYREFYQCDVDVLGSRSMIVEAEIISASIETLNRLGFTDFVVRLNHRKVLTGILDAAGIPEEKHGTALIALDKLDKIGSEGVLREFAERDVLKEDAGKELLALFETKEEVLERLEKFIGSHPIGLEGINELREIIDYTSAQSVVHLDPSLARGLSYYTGAIMEIQVKDLAGSLGGGGRYDNLVGMFLGQDIPACGISLGLERIILIMDERNMFPEKAMRPPADVMVAIWNEESIPQSVALAQQLRASGLRVDLYPDVDKLGKQFKFASARGVPFVAVLGDEERARGEVALKDMTTGEQVAIPQKDLAERLKENHVE